MSIEYCKFKGCGKKFINGKFLETHIATAHPDYDMPRNKGWATPYGFCDFQTPVTYDYACEFMKELTK